MRRNNKKTTAEDKEDTNSTTDRRRRRKLLSCSFCPPHGNENATRYGKHGKTKRKYKDHRSKDVNKDGD